MAQLSPLLQDTALVVTNVTDPSAILSLIFEYNIAEDKYLSLGCYVGFGDDIVSTDPPVLGSEFGSYSDTHFASFRVYF